MTVIWSAAAIDDIASIRSYILSRDVQAARRVAQRIRDLAQTLGDFPSQGRAGQVEGTRELVLTDYPYIIVYRTDGACVTVVRVIHTARAWPEQG